jgi:hypothetical protein
LGDNAQEVALRNAAIKHYSNVVEVGASIIDDTGARVALKIQRQNESLTRATRAASWSVLAIDACLAGKHNVADLYQRAAQLAVTVETSTNGIQRKIGPDDATQQLGDRAGMRFAEAALALAAGNRFLYTRWLRAAEATAKLVELTTPRGRSTAEPKLTFSAAHSEAAVQEADDLEAEATAAAGALQVEEAVLGQGAEAEVQPPRAGGGKHGLEQGQRVAAEGLTKRRKGKIGAQNCFSVGSATARFNRSCGDRCINIWYFPVMRPFY